MADRKPHFLIKGFNTTQAFQSKGGGGGSTIPDQDRTAHGNNLGSQYSNALNQNEERRGQVENPITGIYVEIVSANKCKLPLDSLDNRHFNLCHVKKEGDREVALIFIPESCRDNFSKISVDIYSEVENLIEIPVEVDA